jgi:hypothetical protein
VRTDLAAIDTAAICPRQSQMTAEMIVAATDAFLRAKQIQRREDGTSAEVKPEHWQNLMRQHPSAPIFAITSSQVELAVRRAKPAILAAVRRHRTDPTKR